MSALSDNEVASIFATRYISAVALAILLYDHSLTLKSEITGIWMNKAAGIGNRAGFMVNRYLTTAMVAYVSYSKWIKLWIDDEAKREAYGKHRLIQTSCQVFIWLFAIASTVFVAISHFIIMSRLYTLWDRRILIKYILVGSFGVAISISMVFSIIAAHQVQPFLEYNPFLHMCTFAKKPWALPFMLGALTVFDFFIIIMTIFNALDRPHQKQADVVTALQVDGAIMVSSATIISSMYDVLMLTSSFGAVLRFISLMMAIFGDPSNCFVTLSFVWAMCSMVNSRIQLRVEGLRFIRFTRQPGESSEDVEIYNFPQSLGI
ncbi:hypothetical protein B0H11DRAFT_2229673 [Mycena galericulata]|nr:hypothetical protein B0H11DRAFT_2229673 [Mycena galericulata]